MTIPWEDFKLKHEKLIVSKKLLSEILTTEERAYIAGFLDGDGSIFAQIVPNEDFRYKYQIRVTISFTQHKKRRFFLENLQKKLKKYGTITNRNKNSNVEHFNIVRFEQVEEVLLAIKDYTVLKKLHVNLALDIMYRWKKLKSRKGVFKAPFIEICRIIDRVSDLNDSKRKSTSTETVLDSYAKNYPYIT